MKNILFIVFEFSISNCDYTSGIAKKIYGQCECLKKSGFNVTFFNPYEKNIKKKSFRIIRRMPLFGYLNHWDIKNLDITDYEYIYIRKPWFMDVDTVLFLSKVKKVNEKIKVIMEIPTYPYDYEIENKSLLPLLFKDKVYRKILYRYVDRVVTYSNDDSIWGIKTLKIHNGVALDEKLTEIEETEDNIIHIIAVSNLAFWHGYDRAVKGLYQYYQTGGKRNFVLHIVGDGGEIKKLEALADNYGLCGHIIFYGRKNKDELETIYKRCKVGFDSLGRFRTKITYNSSLKSKEYLFKGLLIITAVDSELDNYENLYFYHKVPANEIPIDFYEVEQFYDSIYPREDEIAFRRGIIEFGEKNFRFEKVMEPVVDYITSCE